MTTLRAVIVDDEPLARRRLRSLLDHLGAVEVVAECEDAMEARDAVAERAPDILFLDVQMPEESGFEVVEALDFREPPAIIFTTAYHEYAVGAFAARAVDYLMKPIDPERLRDAVERARTALSDRAARKLLHRLATLQGANDGSANGQQKYVTRFAARSGNRTKLLRVKQIDWIAAEGNYVRIHLGEASHLMRGTLYETAQELDPREFVRIQRGVIVNINRVTELFDSRDDEHYVILAGGGQRLEVQKAYVSSLRKLIRGY
jgi:two-component system LytT family response regulator